MHLPENPWDSFGTSIFTKMSEFARTHNAINLAQGFPDFDGPEIIKKGAIEAIQSQKNQYAPSSGIPELRQKLAVRQKNRSGLEFDPSSEVTVLSGATEAIFCTLLGVLDPGDEIIAFEPFYDSYPAATLAARGVFKTVPLLTPEWSFDRDLLRRQITTKTRAILINTPHNPTGKVFRLEELQFIANLAEEFNLIVIMDEVYEEIVFKPASHEYFATLPQMRDRTITISSTSKTFSMTGWKIGYSFASPRLTERIRAVHQFNVFCSATPLQYGMLAALDLGEDYFSEFRSEYLQRRDLLVSGLQECGFHVFVPQGSYFAIADYSHLSPLGDLQFSKELTQSYKVAAIPLSPFYRDKSNKNQLLRFAFCKSRETIHLAIDNLRKFNP